MQLLVKPPTLPKVLSLRARLPPSSTPFSSIVVAIDHPGTKSEWSVSKRIVQLNSNLGLSLVTRRGCHLYYSPWHSLKSRWTVGYRTRYKEIPEALTCITHVGWTPSGRRRNKFLCPSAMARSLPSVGIHSPTSLLGGRELPPPPTPPPSASPFI